MGTVLLALDTLVLVVLAVFVVALLRSHAEILRRLAAAGAGADGQPAADPALAALHEDGGEASDIVGETLSGETVKVSLQAGAPTTLLAFLSSGCAACAPLWEGLRAGVRAPGRARLVVVVKDAEEESVAALRELAGAGAELLLCSRAWAAYGVGASPHFVLVDGPSARVAGRGAVASWEQLSSLVEQALADAHATVARERARAGGSTSERARRAERALAAAGIGPGHPSLYPQAAVDERAAP